MLIMVYYQAAAHIRLVFAFAILVAVRQASRWLETLGTMYLSRWRTDPLHLLRALYGITSNADPAELRRETAKIAQQLKGIDGSLCKLVKVQEKHRR